MAGGRTETVAAGGNPPWSGITWRDGAFYVAEGGLEDEGRLLRVGTDGSVTAVVDHLPSVGDHHVDGPVFGPDGALYFGIGTATNAGVVSVDDISWLNRHAGFHDIPCKDVTLTGENFASPNLVSPGVRLTTRTGAFVPFGTPTHAGQVVPGEVPCSGAVFRVERDGSDLELVAWGFRNPFGLAFAPGGQLYVTENGYDDKGSRPVFGSGDCRGGPSTRRALPSACEGRAQAAPRRAPRRAP